LALIAPQSHPWFALVAGQLSNCSDCKGAEIMKSVNEYRTIAEACLRHAHAAQDERDRPLWVTMAQSWLLLAEHRQRASGDFGLTESVEDGDGEPADHKPALN
jgi:hypothetical protein